MPLWIHPVLLLSICTHNQGMTGDVYKIVPPPALEIWFCWRWSITQGRIKFPELLAGDGRVRRGSFNGNVVESRYPLTLPAETRWEVFVRS